MGSRAEAKPPSCQATLPHTPGRTGRSPKGPLVGEMPRTMQSNRKLICSPSAEDRKKTPAPVGTGLSAWRGTEGGARRVGEGPGVRSWGTGAKPGDHLQGCPSPSARRASCSLATLPHLCTALSRAPALARQRPRHLVRGRDSWARESLPAGPRPSLLAATPGAGLLEAGGHRGADEGVLGAHRRAQRPHSSSSI